MKTYKKIKDERIIQLNNKIQSEAFFVVIALLAISIFIKTYILNMTVSEYIAELTIIIVSVIYLSIRGSVVGYCSIDTSKHGKKLTILGILGLSVAITIFNGIRNYTVYGEKYTSILDGHFISILVVTFITSAVFNSIVVGAVTGIEIIGQKRVEKKIENDDK